MLYDDDKLAMVKAWKDPMDFLKIVRDKYEAKLKEKDERIAWLESELMGLCAWGHLVYDVLPNSLVKDATPAIITNGLPDSVA
jgi:hypothetical protein